jgi:17beta-estradiol 17-dehydrogenase / very-long-chain 3-oxoacyl-CoA reductase
LDEDFITNILNINARFPYFITRAFLPSLRRNSQSGPVEVVFIGSIAGDVAVPFFSPYAGSKALTKRVSRILHADERVSSKSSNLSFVYVNVGEVQSGSLRVAASLARPHSDDYARYLVQSFGSGRKMVIPYPVHHIIYAIVTGMPEALCDYIVLAEGRSVSEKIEEGKKKR